MNRTLRRALVGTLAVAEELAQAKWEDVAGIRTPVLRLERLLQMKQESGRPQDLADIEQLQLIADNRKNG